MSFYKRVSIIANIIGIIAVAYIFFKTFQTSCFSIKDWYITLIPLTLSYLSQFLAWLKGEDED